MNHTRLIIAREYLTQVKNKKFLLITLLIPLVLWLKLILNASTPKSTSFFNLLSLNIDGPKVAMIFAFFSILKFLCYNTLALNKDTIR